ncbi:phage tail fiber domain-containing protein, partial [Raoultella ornithinolytica]|uniref:phage tail fiber domain-containing protein n=1 Tax=Raoultella ornithinolytica TaxID=54291 RepID=UPI00403E283B
MSVPNQTPYNIYTANGLSTVFAYEFYLISASDIQVTINGTEVTSGYTVSGVGNTNGGEVTFLTAPANGYTVIFERVTPTYRLTDYQDNGDLLADTVNKDFDRLWMAIQRAFIYLGVALTRPLFGGGPFNANGYRIANLAEPVNNQDAATKKFVIDNGKTNLARTLRVPEQSVSLLPTIVGRKNKLLAFNDQGNPITVLPESGSAADVMISLAESDGLKFVGKCPDIESLRGIEPDFHGQEIILFRAVADGPVLNERLYYDATDTTSEENGFSVFVTPN